MPVGPSRSRGGPESIPTQETAESQSSEAETGLVKELAAAELRPRLAGFEGIHGINEW